LSRCAAGRENLVGSSCSAKFSHPLVWWLLLLCWKDSGPNPECENAELLPWSVRCCLDYCGNVLMGRLSLLLLRQFSILV